MYNANYLAFEFQKRRLEEGFLNVAEENEVEVEVTGPSNRKNKRFLIFCKRAKVNGIPIAFLVYSPYSDKDEDRLKISETRAEEQL